MRNSDDRGLEHFLRLANGWSNDALDELEVPLKFLTSIDSLYTVFIQDLAALSPATSSILLINAHASLRAAIRLALSGQLLPVFMTLRGSVESALYANAMICEPKLQSVWIKRDKSKKARAACRDEFTVGKMFRLLTKAHTEAFSGRIRENYSTTIDFGAHPNNRSVMSSTRIETLGTGEHELKFAYLHGSESFELRQSLIACAEIGLDVFFIALICFQDHPQLKELNEIAIELQDQVPEFVKQLGLSEQKP